MSDTEVGSPGNHPHSNRPNWQPGDDDADELLTHKIADALRDGKSERQIAKLLDISRMMIWRSKIFAAIPKGLFERLMAAHVGEKGLIFIGRLCSNPDNPPEIEIECCPNCGAKLRARSKSILHAIDVMRQWRADGSPPPPPQA
jgi:hypothetical protein